MKKLLTVVVSAILLCNLSTSAFSWDHFGFREGHYYRHAGWWGFGGLVTGLAIGAYVASLPPRYETVVIDGTPYYYADGYYYQASPNGYVVVEPPAGEAPPTGNNTMEYVLGTLLAILLLAGIGVLIKMLFTRQHKSA